MADWVQYVQYVRRAANEHKIRHVFSPRASINGGKLLRNGMKRAKVEDMVLWKGLDEETVKKLKAAVAQYKPKEKPLLTPDNSDGLKMAMQNDGSYLLNGHSYRKLNKDESIQSADVDNLGLMINTYRVGTTCGSVDLYFRRL
jgi:hypothetical protein